MASRPRYPVRAGIGQQSAALPLAQRDGKAMVLLVTSRDTGRWVLPKGWVERRLSRPALAAKEAFEEAGAIGEVAPAPIGRYAYLKRLRNGRSLPCSVEVFAMQVQRLADRWPERRQRVRRWFTLADAAAVVAEADLTGLLSRLAARET